MRERTRDSVRWPSSPSRLRDRDWSDRRRSDQCDASSRCDRSPIRSEWDSRRLDVRRTEWEAGVGGIRREYGDSDPYEAERRRHDGFSKRERERERNDDRRKKLPRFQGGEFAEEVYPDRCESVRTEDELRDGFRGAMQSEEELYRRPEAERSREIDNFVRPTMKQCWRDDPDPSRSICSREHSDSVSPVRNAIRKDEVDWLGSSGSRNFSEMERLQMQCNRTGEHERAEAVFVAMEVERSGKQCCEHGRERDRYVSVSRMSGVESSSAEMQLENYRRVGLNSSSVLGVNDSDRNRRIDSRELGCEGRFCASRVLHTRDLDRYVDRNSSSGFHEDEEAKSLHNHNYLQGRNFCCCVSSTAGKWRKDMEGASRESYCRGGCSSVSGITAKGFCGDDYRMQMGQDPVHYMHMRGPLMKPRVMDSVTNEVDGAGTGVGFRPRERISGLYDSGKEECPFIKRESSILVDRIDEARNCRKVHHEERKDAYLDNKIHHLRKNYQFDSRAMMYPDVNESDVLKERDERALQFRRVCLNKGKEPCPDNESQQVHKDYEFVSYSRRYPDVNRSDVMIDRDERALQARRIYLSSDNESQHVQKDCEYDSYAKMYPDVNGSNVMVDQDLQLRRMRYDKEQDAYLDNGSRELQKDYEYDSYARMYHAVGQPSSLMVNPDEEVPQYSRHHHDGGTLIYLDAESAQLVKADQVNLHTSDGYSFKPHMLGEPVYENIAEVNYGGVEQMRLTYEKPDHGSFGDHEIAYDHIENQYAMGTTTSKQIHYLVDERRSFGHDDQNPVSTPCPRIPVKQRLGGRVKDPSFHVKNRRGPGKKGLPWVRNFIPSRKFHGKN